jgi:epsin
MNYIKNIKNAALYSPYEIKVRDLTSNDPFAGNAQRARKEVAEATSNYENFLVTMRVLWERLNDTGRHWRHVYKGLQLLEYLLVYGAENVVLDAKNNLNRIKILRSFTFVDDHSFNDYGEGVRRLAERVLKTLGSEEKLREYRRQAEDGTFQGFPKLTEASSFAQKKTGGQEERQPQRRRDDDYDDRPRRRDDYDEQPRQQPQRRRDDDYDDRPQRRRDDDYDDRPRRRDDYDEQPRQQPQRRRDDDYDDRRRDYNESPKQQQQYQQPVKQQQQDFDNEDAYGDDDPYLQQYRESQTQQQQGGMLDFGNQPQQQYQQSSALTDDEYNELLQLREQLERARHENEVVKRQLDKARHQYENLKLQSK